MKDMNRNSLVSCEKNSLKFQLSGGSQRCLRKASWALLKNVNPAVSNNSTQTVAVLVLVLSAISDSHPATSDSRTCRICCPWFLFLHLRDPLWACCSLGKGTQKSGEQASPCCCELQFSLTTRLLCRKRWCRLCGTLVSVFLLTAEKGYLSLWFYTQK